MAAENGLKVTVQPPELPFPIFRLSSRRQKYMLYDIDTVTWLRQTHHILGVQIGGLPHFPQQNLLFGLPLELMPEEARLLVDKDLAYVVDDLEMHTKLFAGLSLGEPAAKAAVDAYHGEIADGAKRSQEQAAKAKEAKEADSEISRAKRCDAVGWNAAKLPWIGSDDIQASSAASKSSIENKSWSMTPSTALSLAKTAQQSPVPQLKVSSSGFAIFKYLHDRGYFMSPGIRFGCQFTVYPGDPLRYHSHFLAYGKDWEEEFDLLDIVGGGRLGTGVKKGFLIGGKQTDDTDERVRSFCIEWGGL